MFFFKVIVFFLITVPIKAQVDGYDLLDQVALIKLLIPETKRVGVIVGEKDYDRLNSFFQQYSRDLGILVVKVEGNARASEELQSIYIQMVNILKAKKVQAVLFVNASDRIAKSLSGVKILSKRLSGTIPVFAPYKRAFRCGCVGRFVLVDDWWKMEINAKQLEKYPQARLPEEDNQFIKK